MKLSNIASIMFICTLSVGCNQTAKPPKAAEPIEHTDTATGITTLREIHVDDSVKIGESMYHYKYDFVPIDSVPLVRNTEGDYYKENIVTLQVAKGSSVILKRTFNKGDFSSIVPKEMMETSTLVGFTYNYVASEGASTIDFIVTVGNPDVASDDLIPMNLKVSSNGSFSVEKATDLDTEPVQKGMTVDPDTDEGV